MVSRAASFEDEDETCRRKLNGRRAREQPPTMHRAPTDALTVFTCMWAQVMALQIVKLTISARKATKREELTIWCWPVLMASACFFGIVMPGRGWVTLYLSATSLIVLVCTGSQSNHVFMDMVVCASIILTFARDRSRWRAQAAHAIQLFLVTLYSVTALHKMNADWSEQAWSCCTLMLGGVLALPPLRWTLPFVDTALAPHSATLTELGLPLLLFFPSRRGRRLRAATVLASLFHVFICQMVSPMSVYPFSMLMAPLYVFVIPDEAVQIYDVVKRWAWLLVLVFALCCRIWIPLMADDLPAGEEPFEYPPYGCWAPGVVWCLASFALLGVAAVFGRSAGCASNAVVLPTFRGRMLSLVVAVFGFCPYIGLRTHPALAMFSNLRTEGGRSNHLFLGDDFDFIGWQRDYVTIHETNIRALLLAQVDLSPLFTPATKQALAAVKSTGEFWLTPPLKAWPYPATREFRPYSMPFLELRRRIAPLRAAAAAGNVSGTVVYTRTVAAPRLALPKFWQLLGRAVPREDVVLANLSYDLSVGGDPEIEAPLPWWLATVARFRTFDVNYSPCRH
eukprot:TRINITY_DN32090_c0_g1_i1.p1 TRINITY_DN32090_c0_g1~~TRINITY_DN32090_c0_g1_i1.p1  ORF type:complete len:566 (-),score=83.00 TRINITY_DN32090_c0_g1_i1:50-1747(-)